MKKIYSILLIFVFVFTIFQISNAYSQWKPTNGPYSGMIHSVIVSNTEIIVGTNQIYKSTDNGKIWNVSNNGISGSVTQIMCIVKSSTYLIAGTNAGVFYSSDNGNNWSLSSGTSGLSVYSMVVKGSNVFLSTIFGNGLYKSTNNGQNWSACNTGITTPLLDMRCLAVKGSDIYAGSDGHGIFKSTNDGGSWSAVNSGLPGSYYTVSALAVDGDTILAGTYGAGIYRSTNNGASWSAVNNGVSSSDEIMGMHTHGSTVYASTMTGILYKTTNNTNWNSVNPGNFVPTRYETFYSEGSVLYTGCWGATSTEQSFGLFKTQDNGLTWIQVGITDYPVSVIDVSGSNVLAGTYDVTGNSFRVPFFRTTETDTVWNFNMGGFAGINITALKASGAIAYLFDYSAPGQAQVYRSTNNGNNWTSTGYSVLYNYFTRFIIAGSLVYAADNSSSSSTRVAVSADNGQTWTNVSSGIPSSVLYSYDLVLKGTTLFLGTDNGVYKNTVGQNNWTAVSTGLTNMYIKALWVSGSDLYAGSQGGGVFKSTNDGGNWSDASAGIPLFTNFTSFAATTGKIFAGTDNGVFMTTNSGGSWANVNSGLVDTSITCLTVSSNYLWAGTTAHGVWRRSLSEFIAGIPPQPGPISGNTSVCNGSVNTYSVAPVSGATSYTWTLPNGWTGTSTGNSINANAGSSGTISVTANNSYGSSTAQTLNVTVSTVNTGVTQSGLTLTANAAGAVYEWINCSNYLPVGGQTSQSFTATNPGDYAVIVTQNGCTDTSACYTADTVCNISVSGSDMPYDGFTSILSVDTITSVTIGNAGVSQSWDYSNLTYQYQKYAEYHLTSSTPYASTFPSSNLYTYGPGYMYGSLFGSAPVGSTFNGYVFWKSDNTGFWDEGWRPDGGTFAGVNVFVNTPELLVASPASYGSNFNNNSRWELPMNNNAADPDTFYVRTANKTITADACGSLTTPYAIYPNVLREHEYVIHVDSIYYKSGGITILAYEYLRDTVNNYMYIANGVGYPVCTVHADKNNVVLDVEYYSGPYTSVNSFNDPENNMLLYPNPSDGKIFIEIPDFGEHSFSNILIYNSFGSLVWQQNTPDKNVSVDLSGYSKGMYIVRVTTGNNILIKKVILE